MSGVLAAEWPKGLEVPVAGIGCIQVADMAELAGTLELVDKAQQAVELVVAGRASTELLGTLGVSPSKPLNFHTAAQELDKAAEEAVHMQEC